MNNTCSRCGDSIDDPTREHAAYVRSADFAEDETVEVTEAIVHTQSTRDAVEKLKQKNFPGNSFEEISRAIASETPVLEYLGDPPADPSVELPDRRENAKAAAPAKTAFERVEINDVSEAPEGTIRVTSTLKTKTREKTGLVHPECVDDGDDVIWSRPARGEA